MPISRKLTAHLVATLLCVSSLSLSAFAAPANNGAPIYVPSMKTTLYCQKLGQAFLPVNLFNYFVVPNVTHARPVSFVNQDGQPLKNNPEQNQTVGANGILTSHCTKQDLSAPKDGSFCQRVYAKNKFGTSEGYAKICYVGK